MMKQVIKGFMVFAIIIVSIMWAAWIFVAIWRGVDFFMVFNSIIMATLCLMCWLLTERIEALVGQKRNMIELAEMEHRRFADLRNIILDIKKIIVDGAWREDSSADTLAAIKERLDACKE